jgi:hypothetical protein
MVTHMCYCRYVSCYHRCHTHTARATCYTDMRLHALQVREGSKKLTIDIAITVQGNSSEELPERVLCQTRLIEIDFAKAPSFAAPEA